MVDNPDTWLAFTDLVLIDPVGTGWSRAAKPDGGEAFWGVQRRRRIDGESDRALRRQEWPRQFAEIPSRRKLWRIPRRQGGARVAEAIRAFRSAEFSCCRRCSTARSSSAASRFALGAALQLPSLAAAELERKGTFSKQALAQAEHFALTDYLTALAGPPLQGDAAKNFYARVAAMTGLPEDVVTRQRGFIGDAYVKDLHSSDHKIVSHYDATFAVDDPNPEVPAARAPDPILDGARALLRQRLRLLCARRTRLQNRHDLQSA